ncbi:MAG: hypothetical protein ACJ76N_20380 [Thermoanaerobaculia bacterium]
MLTSEAPKDREEIKKRALAVSGRFRSGLKDLSTEHDRYLEDAFGGESSSSTPRPSSVNR